MSQTYAAVARREIHWNWEEISWLTGVHLLGVVAVAYIAHGYAEVFGFRVSVYSGYTLAMAITLFFTIQFSTSIIAHRNNSHRSFIAGRALHYFFAPFFAGAAQGPYMWWSPNHSPHHAHTDVRKEDRHSPYFGFGSGAFERVLGFLWSHMGWLCTKEGVAMPSPRYVAQMLKHPGVAGPAKWENRHHGKLAIATGFLLPAACGALWNDVVGGILVGCFLRLVANYHCTWVVNSVTHTMGVEVKGAGSARNARWFWALPLAILTVGEANNHGTHHVRPNSWRFGWLDPSAWLIWLFIKVGLAQELKSA
jgi:fatty-acid desaturase